MRTEFLLTDADASITQIGEYEIECGQDMRWMMAINSSGLDGIPQIYVEESADNINWMPLNNNDCNGILDYFPMDDDLISIRDSYFMGKSIRIRVEPNGNTSGLITAKLVVKTKSN
jgi:hypothetical protein